MKDLKEYLIQETIVMTRQGIPSNADYVVYAINVGKIKKDGKTVYDIPELLKEWGIYLAETVEE